MGQHELESVGHDHLEWVGQYAWILQLSSKGFYDEIIVQDFPVRGQSAFLHIKRRRWMNHTLNMVVSRNWDLVAKGTRMTADFAAFLKEIRRF